MHVTHRDRTSPTGQGLGLIMRVAAITALAFALVAASVTVAPASTTTSSPSGPTATASAKTCAALIKKGTKFVPVYERYYKYAFKKVKGTKKYRKVIVRARRKMQVSCTRECVKTKVKKKKRVPVYHVVRKTVIVRKGNRLVKTKKRVRTYVFQKCPASAGNQIAGTPVKVTLLPGSVANLDFGAFKRVAPLTGGLSGFIPGGYKLSQDNQIEFSRANIGLGQTNVFIDDDCHGGTVSAAIRTGTPTNVNLDATRQSISTLTAAGGITATAYTKIQLPLELRNDDDGCDRPYITTGYTEFLQTFFLKGKLQKGLGLSKVTLTSAPDPLDVQACLAPGSPTSPCNNSTLIIPLPIIVSTHLVVAIKVG